MLSDRKRTVQVLFITLFVFGYAYGAVVISNCYFDTSVPKQYHALVLAKRVSTGEHTSYYLTLSAWGTETEPDETDVGHTFYNKVAVNDLVSIYYRDGAWGIPWFEVGY